MRTMLRWCAVLLLNTFAPTHTLGQNARGDITSRQAVRKAKNPFARVILIPVEFDTARPIGSFSRVQDALTIQPLIPFLLGTKWDLITQTFIPVLSQPDLQRSQGRNWGLSDISTNLYFSPDNQDRVHWGFGPALLFPTASDEAVGTGKWGIGPTAALVVEPGNWTLGIQVNNVKAFAGDSTRSDVHYMALSYQVTHNFWKTWYVTSSPTALADWTLPPAERWLMPIGLGLGKVFAHGERQVSVELSSYYSLVHPRTQPYPKWLFSLQFGLSPAEAP